MSSEDRLLNVAGAAVLCRRHFRSAAPFASAKVVGRVEGAFFPKSFLASYSGSSILVNFYRARRFRYLSPKSPPNALEASFLHLAPNVTFSTIWAPWTASLDHWAMPNVMFFDMGITLCALNMTVHNHGVLQIVAKRYVFHCLVLLLGDSL